MKIIYIAAILTLLPVSLLSQFYISGSVKDKNNEAVSYASVTLLQHADSSIVSYTVTNNSGTFKIETKNNGRYLLRVNCLGYLTQEIPIIFTVAEAVTADFVLDDNITELAGVNVTGRNIGIKFRQDTIRYDPKVFTDGSEVVLGDVLNKLPGIEVNTKGGVTAQGKQVENILLNGQDFFSGNTQLATKNLPANVAENVEILNNYSEYSLLEGFQSHEKTVINIGVNKEKLGKLSGEVTAAGGYHNKYLGKANAMLINPKLMTSFIGAHNNTGEEVFNIEEYIRLQGGISELITNNSGSSIKLSKEEEQLLMPKNNVYKRINALSALNMAYQPKTQLKITSYLLFNETNENAQNQENHNYLLPEGNFKTAMQTDGKAKNRLFSGLWKMNYQLRPSLNLTYKGDISNIDMNRSAKVQNITGNQEINAIDINDAQTIKTRHDVQLMKSVERHLLAANLYFSYSHKPADYNMQTDSLLLPIPLIAENGWYYGKQNTRINETEKGTILSFMYKINESYFINSSLNVKINNQNFTSRLYQSYDNKSSEKLNADSLQNDIKTEMHDYNAGVNLVKNSGFLRFKLGVFAHSYKFKNNMRTTENREKLSPIMDISLFFSQKHVLNISLSKTEDPIQADAFISGIIMGSHLNYTHNSLTQHNYSSKYNADLSYRLYDLFSNTMIVLTSMYNRTKNPAGNDYSQNGLLTQYQPVTTLPKEFFITKLYVNKGLGFIPWSIKINGGYNNTSFSNQSMGIRNRINAESISGSFRLESNYRNSIFNFECSTSHEYINNKSSLYTVGTQKITSFECKIKANINKRFFAATGLEHIINDAPYYNKKQYNLNANVIYTLSKSFDLEINGTNLLNMDRQDWVAVSYNGVYMSERYFRQIPGNLMIKLKYKI